MTTTPRLPRSAVAGAPARALDGAMLRLGLDDPRWAEQLPPVPAGRECTVSFSSEAAAGEHAEALGLLGYRVAGVVEEDGEPCALVHVAEALLRDHPMWWRALANHADRAYNLAVGPVQVLLAPALRLHAGA